MLPSRQECLALLEKHCVPEHVIMHSLAVEKVAVFLAKKLAEKGELVDVELVSRAALLHDIDKIKSLELGSGHGTISKQILEEEGFPLLGMIAFKHHLSQILSPNPFSSWEEKIVYYADKRVTNHYIVSLEERFRYLLERYGSQKETFEKISSCKPPLEKLEKEIFNKLDIDSNLSELK
jgi:putative nucleotidyltransferase with HDIG domain